MGITGNNSTFQGASSNKKWIFPLCVGGVLLLFILGAVIFWNYSTVQVEKAALHFQTQIEEEWDDLLENWILYQHFKDFSEEQYYFNLRGEIPIFMETLTPHLEIYSDYGQEKLKFTFDLMDTQSHLYLSDKYVTLDTPALSNIYGAYVDTFVEDWNNAFFTTTDLPLDMNIDIFQWNDSVLKDLMNIILAHGVELMDYIEIEKMEKKTIEYQGETKELSTYSLYLPPDKVEIGLESLFSSLSAQENIISYFVNVLNISSSTTTEETLWTEEMVKISLQEVKADWIRFFQQAEKGAFSVSIQGNDVVQLTYEQGNELAFLRFDNPDQLLQSITLQNKGQELNLSLVANASLQSFTITQQGIERFVFQHEPLLSGNNVQIRQYESQTVLFSLDSSQEDKLLFDFGNGTIFLSEKQEFPEIWFNQTDHFQPFFQLSFFEFLILFGDILL